MKQVENANEKMNDTELRLLARCFFTAFLGLRGGCADGGRKVEKE